MDLCLYRKGIGNGDSYYHKLNARGSEARFWVTIQRYGRVYEPTVVLTSRTNNRDGKADTKTKTKEVGRNFCTS